jgi:hypothetical protein
MKLKSIAVTVSLLALVAPWASAGEKHTHDHDHDSERRQHGAHVHGIATLNLALEGREVHIEFDSPAANIVGFEHAPSSQADLATLNKAVAMLKDGDRLFRFNAAAGCEMEQATVTSALLDEQGKMHSGDHDHEKKHGHAEEEHADHGATHADIEAAYHFECKRPDKLTQLSVELFEAFPGTGKLNVQYIIENKQGAAELTPAGHVIRF